MNDSNSNKDDKEPEQLWLQIERLSCMTAMIPIMLSHPRTISISIYTKSPPIPADQLINFNICFGK